MPAKSFAPVPRMQTLSFCSHGMLTVVTGDMALPTQAFQLTRLQAEEMGVPVALASILPPRERVI